MIEEGRHARPKPGTTGAAFRKAHPSHRCWRIYTCAGSYWDGRSSDWSNASAAYRNLRRRSCDPVQEGQCRPGTAATAQDHEQAEAHGQRGEDTNLQGPGRGVRLPGLHVRTDVLKESRPGAPGLPAIEEEHQAHG